MLRLIVLTGPSFARPYRAVAGRSPPQSGAHGSKYEAASALFAAFHHEEKEVRRSIVAA
jgi:hypothetical protein